MEINIDQLKKKIIYRASYRGTKEMDILLTSFVNKIIHDLDLKNLKELLELLELDDDTLYKFNRKTIDLDDTQNKKIYKMFREHRH
ncbi:succinate dehydrogenase assembly factor 2 [Pelagibacterales bacterium SAG-MED15]|nr:succinate dehydrogenase assembly factor 2 [Pelagibacterales bacterium SAG-MED15]